MPSVMECSGYNCSELFIETLFSGILLTLMFQGLRVILNDHNQTLVKIDRVIYYLATLNMGMLTLYFFAWGSTDNKKNIL